MQYLLGFFYFLATAWPKFFGKNEIRNIQQANSIIFYIFYFLKNSLIIHEENTKKNHKRIVSVYVIQIPLIYINFNFDFLGVDNVYFENNFANNQIISFV